ncbi:MAG: aromatic ring-hydroxylating dioxygenase subunit alpha [Myxococcales bacterium]|nr:aromatic ring-hydroxylating dioxygenase subunit alpha [Myxococcales bacterium]
MLALQQVFNNWDAVPLGWYLLGPSAAVRPGTVRPYVLCGQRIVVFRGEDARLRGLDAFCPHMGTDLAIGRVDGNQIRCFFHHWRFDGAGACTDIPCGEPIPARARTQSYDVREKYGFIWIWPDSHALSDVPGFPELDGVEVYAMAGRTMTRSCHPTVNMINGLDAQHLRTVHRIPLQMTLKTQEEADGRTIEFRMEADLPSATPLQRIVRAVLGPRYAYSMRYVDATVGLLRTLEDVRWFGRWPAEPTRMIFAYTPLAVGKGKVQPVYIARRPRRLLSRMAAWSRLALTAAGFLWLRDEDGKIYENIRFRPNALLNADAGIARFIHYVNRLTLSRWSSRGRPAPYGAPGVDAPGVDTPGVDTPGVDAPGVDAPGVDAPA